MSKLVKKPCTGQKPNYYYKISKQGIFYFEGIGQLEAGTKFTFSRLIRKGEKIQELSDKIIGQADRVNV